MKLAVFNTFKKLMGQTISESDGEALNALRAANRLLEREGVTWERVLDRSMRVEYEVEQAPTPTAPQDVNKNINAAFAVLEGADLADDFAEFICSLRDQYRQKGRLSDKQLAALLKAAERERAKT